MLRFLYRFDIKFGVWRDRASYKSGNLPLSYDEQTIHIYVGF